MKKILVTGGAGFLGSHLCERLLKEGEEVFCLDNFFTGRRENVSAFFSSPFFHLIEHDVCNPFDLEIDCIYNLASPASPIHYQINPVKTLQTNVLGMLHMLELAKRYGATLFQASTSEVYGDPQVHPQPESYWGHVNPIGSRSCYDEGKRCAETLCFDYARQYAVPVKVGRIFNTYGPRMHIADGRVVSNFIVQALKNEPITIYGDGSQTRSFAYVDDMIDAFIKFMQTSEEETGPINLGNPVEMQMIELAELILELVGSSSTLVFKPLPQDDPRQRKPDITLAKQKLQWTPKTRLREGLLSTIDYFRTLDLLLN